jgi:uncharacterized membrane protein YkvA (DUF1232 family)
MTILRVKAGKKKHMKPEKDPTEQAVPKRRRLLRDAGMLIAGVIAVIYLLNPDAGLIELIPDNIPVVGNLDEVAATILLLRVLVHFGWVPGLFRKGVRRKK